MARLFTAERHYGHTLSKGLLAAGLTGSPNLFQILDGPVKVISLGMLVTTALPAGANTLKFQHTPEGGSATDLCGVLDTASAAKMAIFVIDGVKATNLVKNTDTGIMLYAALLHMPIILAPGTIKAVFSAGPPATGAVQFFFEYEPVSGYARTVAVA